MKFLYYGFLVCFLWLNSPGCFAQKDTLRVLFVGNSYTYYSDLPKMVSGLSRSTSTYLETTMSAVGGARLKYHFHQTHGLRTKALIKKGNFDIVVIQAQSMATLTHKKEFLLYAKKLSTYSKQNGAIPYFFATWSREKTPQTQQTISATYKEAARSNQAKIVHVGSLWAKALKTHPQLDLYTNDGSHPTFLGTFLTASIFVKTLTNQLPLTLKSTKNTFNRSLQLCLNLVHQANMH